MFLCQSLLGYILRHRLPQILFGFSVILFWGDLKQSSGLDSGHWFWGTMLYMAVLLTVLGKAALISEYVCSISSIAMYVPNQRGLDSLWTKYTVAGEPRIDVFHWIYSYIPA